MLSLFCVNFFVPETSYRTKTAAGIKRFSGKDKRQKGMEADTVDGRHVVQTAMAVLVEITFLAVNKARWYCVSGEMRQFLVVGAFAVRRFKVVNLKHKDRKTIISDEREVSFRLESIAAS